MPLPGEGSLKKAVPYECLWTVDRFVDILQGSASSIRLGPPGSEGRGVELWLQTKTGREYHQVKRQQSESCAWSLSALGKARVLADFWEKLQSPPARCIFTSMQDALQLRELVERASDSASLREFQADFLQAAKWKKAFDELRSRWGDCKPDDAYDALRRIEVHTIDDVNLRVKVEARIAPLVDGNATSVVDALAHLTLTAVHRELRQADLWAHLKTRGFCRRRWHEELDVLRLVEAQNTRYLDELRGEAIAGDVMIPRQEAQDVLEKLTAPGGRQMVLISGSAGSGKSAAVLQVADAMLDRGWPVLAFRIDRLDVTTDMGEALGLPASPAAVLAGISQGGPCMLVIDQLDAVSWVSGRLPAFSELVHRLLGEARAHPNMRVLLACRKFDLGNDPKLRRLVGENGVAEEVPLSLFAEDTVRQVVQRLGLDAQRLTGKQLDLLSIPLHLALLAELVEGGEGGTLDLDTARELYDRFWERKRRLVQEKAGRHVDWTRVIDCLCDYMSERQVLSVPEDILDDYADDADAMASEHVLVRDRRRYAFFHEGFFDYAFARRFVGRGQGLLPMLFESEQHLFRRAQVRQVLLHEREADWQRYLADLDALVHSDDIRYHIKEVIFALLRDCTDPRREEWEILSSRGENEGLLRDQRLWRVLSGSTAWFQLLDSVGVFQRWLASPESQRSNFALTLLRIVQRECPDRVGELVEPHIGQSDEWRQRLVHLVQWSDLHAGRGFFDMVLRLIDDGTLDDLTAPIASNADFWLLCHDLPDKKPEWSCELIGRYLSRRLHLSLEAGQPNPFDDGSGTIQRYGHGAQVLIDSAKGAPATFLQHVLPFMLAVMAGTAVRREGAPWCDPVWDLRTFGEAHSIEDALLVAAETALRALALDRPEEYRAIVVELREVNFETAQFLIVRSYAANGSELADEAADYLLDTPSALDVGWAVCGSGDSSNWASRELLAALAPHCTGGRLRRLEQMVMAYYTDWERSADGRRFRGRRQYVLLEGIPRDHLSRAASRRLDQLRRRFAESPPTPPKRFGMQQVGSPIPEKAAGKMTDAQWLSAIVRYSEDHERIRQDGKILGGACELSHLLQQQVEEEPERFAQLLLRFPCETNKHYYDAVLRGIAGKGLGPSVVLAAMRRCHGLAGCPCGQTICEPVLKSPELDWPGEALDIVAWYATEDPDPEREFWRTEASLGGVYYGGDIFTAGINCVRGRAAEAIGALIFEDPSRLDGFRPALQRMVQDPSIAVRSCVAQALLCVLRHDRDLAVSLFLRLCDTEDVLLGTSRVERFLYYAIATHFEALVPTLERMIASEVEDVATAGARQACLAALSFEEARLFAERCLAGGDALRVGAAGVFATNAGVAELRSYCDDVLCRLFDDPSQDVRRKASGCFRHFGDAELGNHMPLVEAFTNSAAFTEDCNDLIRALDETTAELPQTGLAVCERFLDGFGDQAGDIRTAAAREADRISRLIVRTYSQSRDEAMRSRCLDAIDRMAELAIYGYDKALASLDR